MLASAYIKETVADQCFLLVQLFHYRSGQAHHLNVVRCNSCLQCWLYFNESCSTMQGSENVVWECCMRMSWINYMQIGSLLLYQAPYKANKIFMWLMVIIYSMNGQVELITVDNICGFICNNCTPCWVNSLFHFALKGAEQSLPKYTNICSTTASWEMNRFSCIHILIVSLVLLCINTCFKLPSDWLYMLLKGKALVSEKSYSC